MREDGSLGVAGTAVPRTNPSSMQIVATEPELDWTAIWREFGDGYVSQVRSQAQGAAREIERELLFCLLGGHGVPFELAYSATHVLAPLEVFSSHWDVDDLEASVRLELNQAQFEPRRRDGHLRRYRYPARKAYLIARAAAWTWSQGPILERLAAMPGERERRALLCECPGVGLKTASWVLRNIGLADELAVIDIHVLRALVDAGRVGEVRLPRDYLVVEERFLEWCDDLGALPAAFDLLLWEWQRAA